MLACLWCTVCKKMTYNTTTRRGLSIPRTTSWLRAYASLAGGYGRSYYMAGSSARELCHLPSLRQQLPPFSHHAPPLPFRFTPRLDHQAIPTLIRFFPPFSACHSSLPSLILLRFFLFILFTFRFFSSFTSSCFSFLFLFLFLLLQFSFSLLLLLSSIYPSIYSRPSSQLTPSLFFFLLLFPPPPCPFPPVSKAPGKLSFPGEIMASFTPSWPQLPTCFRTNLLSILPREITSHRLLLLLLCRHLR